MTEPNEEITANRLNKNGGLARGVVQGIALILLFGAGWLLRGFLPGGPPIGPPPGMGGPSSGPPLVNVDTVREGLVESPKEFIGHVESVQTVDLYAQVVGNIALVHFEEGQEVKEGDLLFTIEQNPYKARVSAAEARLAQAKASYEGTRADLKATQANVKVGGADLDAANADFERADKYLKRMRSADKRSIVQSNLDTAESDYLGAQARVTQAKALIQQRESQVLQAKARLKQTDAQILQAESDLDLARIDLGYTEIRSPIVGRIGKAVATKGNYVGPNTGSLARIVQMDPIRAVYSISENDLATIQAARRDTSQDIQNRLLAPQIKLADGDRYPITGQIEFIDNQIDPSIGSIAVWAKFDNPDHLLFPGQYVTALVSESAPVTMPLVPQAAVMVNQQGRYVLVVDSENQAVARPIVIGPPVGSMYAVESGLEAGEKIIVQGIQKVQPGQTVQIASGKPEGR